MADGGNKLAIITRELQEDEMALLFKLRNKEGYFLFKMSEILEKEIDVPEVAPEFKGEKTQSQRLRNVIYVLWENNRKDGQTSDSFYHEYMNKVIDMVKEKLD